MKTVKERLQGFWGVLVKSSKAWYAKDPFKESAVIAYYAIFSLPGLLAVVIATAGVLFGKQEVTTYVSQEIGDSFGKDTSKQIEEIIALSGAKKNTLFGAIIGIATILVGATGVFAQFQKSLNAIWEVKTDDKNTGFLHLLRVRLFSFGLIIAIAFILVVSLVASTLLAAFGTWLAGRFSESFVVVLQVVNFVVSFFTITLLFALMFKFFPDAKIQWRHVWIGSMMTALLFEIGKFALELYFGKLTPEDGYGAAGSIILILLWVSYSSMIVFFGAEFTHAYAVRVSGKVAPTEIAKPDPAPKPAA